MALDFAYTLYLILNETKEVSVGEIKRIVQKWYVLSVLTRRYTTSPESVFARDIRLIRENGVVKTLKEIEDATLSDTYWNVAIPQSLESTSTNNPTYLVYLAAQVMRNDVSLLSTNILVRDLIGIAGAVHHIFPKAYLKKKGFDVEHLVVPEGATEIESNAFSRCKNLKSVEIPNSIDTLILYSYGISEKLGIRGTN